MGPRGRAGVPHALLEQGEHVERIRKDAQYPPEMHVEQGKGGDLLSRVAEAWRCGRVSLVSYHRSQHRRRLLTSGAKLSAVAVHPVVLAHQPRDRCRGHKSCRALRRLNSSSCAYRLCIGILLCIGYDRASVHAERVVFILQPVALVWEVQCTRATT